jgi:hypothetical protein
VRRHLRSESEEPKFNVPDRPSKLDPFADKLSHRLRQEAGKSRKQKRTILQLHADLAALGYEGSYNRVAAFAREWKAARQREQRTTGRGVFAPLAFSTGEAFQFDWSEDWAVIAGERTKLQVAHFKLSYSRAFFLRAYLQQTHEMLFDAHNHAFRVPAWREGQLGSRRTQDRAPGTGSYGCADRNLRLQRRRNRPSADRRRYGRNGDRPPGAGSRRRSDREAGRPFPTRTPSRDLRRRL